MNKFAPYARIILRYGFGALVAAGSVDAFSAETIATDEDLINLVAIGIGAIGGVLNEIWYKLAKRYGWAT